MSIIFMEWSTLRLRIRMLSQRDYHHLSSHPPKTCADLQLSSLRDYPNAPHHPKKIYFADRSFWSFTSLTTTFHDLYIVCLLGLLGSDSESRIASVSFHGQLGCRNNTLISQL